MTFERALWSLGFAAASASFLPLSSDPGEVVTFVSGFVGFVLLAALAIARATRWLSDRFVPTGSASHEI